MDSFNKRNLHNIKTIFQEKTGVELHQQRRPVKVVLLIAAILVCGLALTAFSTGLFSGLSGDEMAISATYKGNGIVSVHVENQSDKDLSFQPQLKLMRWNDNEEIAALPGNVIFSGTEIKAHTSGIMTIDLSQAYDIAALEQPLVDDHYFLVLTNNDFTFGQDWMCSVYFAEPVYTVVEPPEPIAPAEADTVLATQVLEELRPFFDCVPASAEERRELAQTYWETCQKVLSQMEIRLVSPVFPAGLVAGDVEDGVVFDETVPLDMQRGLTSAHSYVLDGYGLPIGAEESEHALVLGALVPQRKGDLDGGAEVPLVYLVAYETGKTKNLDDYTFIHGQLLTFRQLEQYKFYEDEQYVCYEVTDLFYTDLRSHVEAILSQRSDVYFDEQVWNRVQNIYDYYRDRETLKSSVCYRLSSEPQQRFGPWDACDLY